MPIESNAGGITITGPEIRTVYRALVLRSGLKLEIKGLSKRGPSCYSIIKKELGFRGSKQRVLDQYEAYLREQGVLKEDAR